MTMHQMTIAHERTLTASNNFRARTMPNNFIEFGMFTSVTFQVVVTAVTGSPTGWSISSSLQLGATNLTGSLFSSLPVFRAFTAEEYMRYVRGGSPMRYGANVPPVLFTQADGTGKIAQITIDNPPNLLQLVLTDPVFTGGTDPSISVSVNALCEM